ncbi:MAG: DUF3037 domain-containing protein [Solirubrobacteraceae bacterium]
MSEAYQYALWRSVPDAEREESVNVGIVLYAPRLRFIGARAHLDRVRLAALLPTVDVDAVAAALDRRLAVAAGAAEAGAVAALDAGDRFGLLVAPSSTVVRPGPVHTGLCDEAASTLERLFERLVLPPGR